MDVHKNNLFFFRDFRWLVRCNNEEPDLHPSAMVGKLKYQYTSYLTLLALLAQTNYEWWNGAMSSASAISLLRVILRVSISRALCRTKLLPVTHVLVDTCMLTVKSVYKLSNVSDDLKWTTNTLTTPFTLILRHNWQYLWFWKTFFGVQMTAGPLSA